MKIKLVTYFIVVFTFSSCVLHKAYVPSGFEPVIVQKKYDNQVSVTLRPFDYLNLDGTYAFANHFAIRNTIGGTYQLYNATASLIYFNKIKNCNYFIAPLYTYQNNKMIRNYSFYMVENGNNVNYNCIYHSLGTAFGFSIPKTKVQHHFIVKPQYNFVNNYRFDYLQDNASGKSDYYKVLDEEYLNKKIPSFFSFEISYAILFKFKWKYNFFKIQAGLNLCKRTYTHNYSFIENKYTSRITTVDKGHPTNWPVFLSVGFMF